MRHVDNNQMLEKFSPCRPCEDANQIRSALGRQEDRQLSWQSTRVEERGLHTALCRGERCATQGDSLAAPQKAKYLSTNIHSNVSNGQEKWKQLRFPLTANKCQAFVSIMETYLVMKQTGLLTVTSYNMSGPPNHGWQEEPITESQNCMILFLQDAPNGPIRRQKGDQWLPR